MQLMTRATFDIVFILLVQFWWSSCQCMKELERRDNKVKYPNTARAAAFLRQNRQQRRFCYMQRGVYMGRKVIMYGA